MPLLYYLLLYSAAVVCLPVVVVARAASAVSLPLSLAVITSIGRDGWVVSVRPYTLACLQLATKERERECHCQYQTEQEPAAGEQSSVDGQKTCGMECGTHVSCDSTDPRPRRKPNICSPHSYYCLQFCSHGRSRRGQRTLTPRSFVPPRSKDARRSVL
jgi:hypothetical protein